MDIASVDVIWNGFAQARKIADLAETHEVACAPHNYYSHLATFIAAQWCAVIPNVRMLEVDVDDVPWREVLTTAVPEIAAGELVVPVGAGLGLRRGRGRARGASRLVMRARLGITLAYLERMADRRRGAVLLFGVALVVYAVVSVGVPLHEGRDIGTTSATTRSSGITRQLCRGPCCFEGRSPRSSSAARSTSSAGSARRSCWDCSSPRRPLPGQRRPERSDPAQRCSWRSRFSPTRAGVLLFHSLASDAISAAGFAGWSLLVARAAVRPTALRFALVGLGVGLLALVRPGNQVLLLVGSFPVRCTDRGGRGSPQPAPASRRESPSSGPGRCTTAFATATTPSPEGETPSSRSTGRLQSTGSSARRTGPRLRPWPGPSRRTCSRASPTRATGSTSTRSSRRDRRGRGRIS